MKQQSDLRIFRNDIEKQSKAEQQLKEQEEYIKKLKLQIEHQQNTIKAYEQRLQYFQNALQQANQRQEKEEALSKRKRGRPALLKEQREQVRVLVNQGLSYRKVHEMTGISLGMISSIVKDETAKEE